MTRTTAPVPELAPAVAAAVGTVRRNAATFGDRYPDDTTCDGRYPLRPAVGGVPEGGNRGWTTSFWPGMQWLAWELTGDDALRSAATRHVVDFARRERDDDDLDTHDLGFLYTLSCVTAVRLTGAEEARAAALAAAARLADRFLEPAGVVQAWGDLDDPRQRGRTIIDSLMNMPLLTWAGARTGDPRYTEVVRRHTEQLRRHIVRDDDSTFHTFHWDVVTGEPLHGTTQQGAHDGSTWARGQAWGIYGFALAFAAVGDHALLDAARRCADHYLAHLPADGVAYWDLVYGDGSDEPRDSSAAAIAVCGLDELATHETDPVRRARYRAAGGRMLRALAGGYTPEAEDVASDALLLHGVYSRPRGAGVDEGNLWGDYFYLEALVRATLPGWVPYWRPDARDGGAR